jgi:uncharacterized membrane protein
MARSTAGGDHQSGVFCVPNAWLSGAGVAFACGLNATLPLLILGLADRISDGITLEGRFDFLSSNAGLLILLLLLPIELIGDKIPQLDTINDLLHTLLRPVAGAIAFMAIGSQESLNPWITGTLGLAIAGVVHAWKMRTRPSITGATKGLGNPFASLVEDTVSIVVTIASLVSGWLALVTVPLGVAWLWRTYGRLVSGESRLIRLFTPRAR